LLTAVLWRVTASGGCSGARGNVLAVGNCCYVADCSVMQGASADTGEERGGAYCGGRPPAYSLFLSCVQYLNDARYWTLLPVRLSVQCSYYVTTVTHRQSFPHHTVGPSFQTSLQNSEVTHNRGRYDRRSENAYFV